MGIFGSILSKLGLGDEKKDVVAEAPAVSAAPDTSDAAPAAVETAPVVAPVAISDVDVVAKLDELASARDDDLNWKTSQGHDTRNG